MPKSRPGVFCNCFAFPALTPPSAAPSLPFSVAKHPPSLPPLFLSRAASPKTQPAEGTRMVRNGWGRVGALVEERRGRQLFRMSMEEEREGEGGGGQAMEAEEQIMILLEGLEAEEDPDLLDLLGCEPQTAKKGSLNYDYQPAQVQPLGQEQEEGGLKTSNRSTSTCADSDPPRRCTCARTRCQKNYCECFKLGEACTALCECRDCGNRERLFLGRTAPKVKCRCLKSHCLKNYCECHSMGLRCGPDCRCLHCQNLDPCAIDTEEPHSHFDTHLYFDI